jgi:hypothetical protein
VHAPSDTQLTAAEAQRFDTWVIEVATSLLGVSPRLDADEARFPNTGGLNINRQNGAWYAFARGVGGHSALQLVHLLRPDWAAVDATQWAIAFLAAHQGTGAALGSDEVEGNTAAAASEWMARQVLQDAMDLLGTSTETYLNSRNLYAPFPSCVRHLANARTGEDAVVGILSARGRTVGVQVGYIAPSGQKTTIPPQRRRFVTERGLPGYFDIQGGDLDAPAVVVEGLEDGLSLRQAWPHRIWGLPGISALTKLDAIASDSFIIFRDGDAAGSPAARGLQDGVDHLLLCGAEVRVTSTPEGQDANSLLQDGKLDVLRELIEQAPPAALSMRGDAQRLSRLPEEESAQERRQVAKRHGVPVSTIDKLVRAARAKTQSSTSTAAAPAEDPWDGPIDLCEILDAALIEARRYIVASDTKRGALVLWSAHTHLVHNVMVGLQRSPRLAIQSRLPGSGKTTSLEFVAALSSRGVVRSSATASTILRTMGSVRRTYCLDEADRQLSEKNSDMVAILDCGDRRSTSVVERSVPNPKGGWDVGTFDVWGAVAFAGIDELPGTLQDRSVRVFLQKATVAEVPEHLRDGTSTELVTLRRQLTAWADSLFELPDPELPDVLLRQAGRVGDRWRPLIAIADLAGGQWPKLVRDAAQEDVEAEQQPDLIQRLLVSIRSAFNDAQGATIDADNKDRLTTTALIGVLLNDREEEWLSANRGNPITAYYLRTKLRGLLEPRGAQDWWTGPAGHQQHHRGYLRLQFEDAWRRYAPAKAATSFSHAVHPETSSVSSVSGVDTDKPLENNEFPTPDDTPDAASTPDAVIDPVEKKRRKSTNKRAPTLDTPDTPDVLKDRGGENTPAAKLNGEAGDDATESSEGPVFAASWTRQQIRDLQVAHPRWSIAKIAREAGQPERVVKQVLESGAA